MNKCENGAMNAKQVPIETIITQFTETHCGVSKDTSVLQDNITKSLGAFVHGDILTGITAIVSEALTVLMGNVAANSAEKEYYAITVGNMGGIGQQSRIDTYMYYYYKYISSSLSTVIQDCLLVTSVIISSADPTALKKKDVLNLVQNQYSAPLPNDQPGDALKREQAIYKLVEDNLDQSKQFMFK